MRPALLLAAALTLSAAACKQDPRPTYRTCAEAQAAGNAPIPNSHPAYRLIWDRDHDGYACEPGD